MQFFETGIEWEKGNCVGMPVNAFFDVEEMRTSPERTEAQELVRSICFSCPIWNECLKWGFSYEEFGVWGGLTGVEREFFATNKFYENRVRLLKSIEKYGITEDQIRSLIFSQSE